LPLIPYFEVKKNKWVAVLAFDQEKLRANNLNAYNPFLKIIAVRFTKQSTTGNFISEFTQPKFINIVSERFVTVRKVDGKKEYWHIEISNKEQVKLDNSINRRSIFVACLRELSNYNITGKIVKSTDMLGYVSFFHLIQEDMIDIQIQMNKSLCIYEFETFDNNITDINNVNWLQDPKARLVYAENFK